MTAYTGDERALAARLYARFVGPDLADRLPLRRADIGMQRQWCAVARLAIELLGPLPDPSITDLERAQVVRVGFALPLAG